MGHFITDNVASVRISVCSHENTIPVELAVQLAKICAEYGEVDLEVVYYTKRKGNLWCIAARESVKNFFPVKDITETLINNLETELLKPEPKA